MDTHVVLTVRGRTVPPTLEAARVLHNETAGSPQGIAAARALGDLSHKVYAPRTGAEPGELLFLDAWADPAGIGQFFANPHVQEQAARMFSAREPAIWMPARDAFTWALQAPAGRNERYVGIVRGPVADPRAAIAAFAEADRGGQRDARRRGLVSHELFVKIPMPGDAGPVELLGIDVWFDAAGMDEHYADPTHLGPLSRAFTGRPSASTWAQAPGTWSEW